MLPSLARAGPSRLPSLCLTRPACVLVAPIQPVLAQHRQISTSRLLPRPSPRLSSKLRPSPITFHRTSTTTSTSSPPLSTPLHAPPPLPPTALDRYLPKWAEPAKPYILLTRFDKPIGSALLYWPCAWSITMASAYHHLPITTPLWYMALFGVGAVIMRGAGCTINDMWDVKYDRAVERTKNRPIARGDVSQFQALRFLGLQLSAGLAVLTQLNWYSIVLGASSLGLVVLYPLMKRITYYPQIIFGMTFSWGTLLGWSAVAGAVNWAIVAPMYIAKVAWGVAYDTIYAHQDKRDDVLVGVKSTALAHPNTSRELITGLNATFISLMSLSGYLAGMGRLYYLISMGGASAHLAWQCWTVDFDNRQDCWKKFCSNGFVVGPLIWFGIMVDYIWRVVLGNEEEAVEQATDA